MSRTYTLKTTCSRCSATEERELSAEDLAELAEPTDETPAVQVIINGVVDYEAQHLCGKCPSVVQNYTDRIARRPAKKAEAEPVATLPVHWDPGNGEYVWVTGKVGVDSKAYSHKAGEGVFAVIPALEGVTDPAEAGTLIAAHNEDSGGPGTGEPATGGEESAR